ncbi:MAG: hypothetical protein WCG91_01700 [Candidatus Shapirobacteria bacterium]
MLNKEHILDLKKLTAESQANYDIEEKCRQQKLKGHEGTFAYSGIIVFLQEIRDDYLLDFGLKNLDDFGIKKEKKKAEICWEEEDNTVLKFKFSQGEIRFRINGDHRVALFYSEEGRDKSIVVNYNKSSDDDKIVKAFADVINKRNEGGVSKYVTII